MQEETRNQEEKKNELEMKKNFKNQMPLKILLILLKFQSTQK